MRRQRCIGPVLQYVGFLLLWSVAATSADVIVGPDNIGSVQKALDQSLPGDVITLRDGVYRDQPICFNKSGLEGKPITLRAADGAKVVFKGSDVVSDWTRAESEHPIYYHGAWPHAFGKFSDTGKAGADARSRPRNQLFLDGLPMVEVQNIGEMSAGTFFIDAATKTIDLWCPLGDNPAVHLVEVSNTDQPLLTTNGQSYLCIQGIGFEHGANPPQQNALVRIEGGTNCVADHIAVEYAAGAGITVTGERHLIRESKFNHNGQLGIHSSRAVNCRFERCETSFNNTIPGKEFDSGWEAGGNKFSRSGGVMLDGLVAHDNHGSGIWFDISNHDATIINCISYNNCIGIQYEISYTGLIANNLCYTNRLQGSSPDSPSGIGIYISSSAQCRVINNTVWRNDTYGILLGGAVRDDGNNGKVFSHSAQLFNNIIASNQEAAKNGKSFMPMLEENWSEAMKQEKALHPEIKPNESDYNLFWLDSTRPFFVAYGSARPNNLPDWQKLSGMDAHSLWGNPQFTDLATGNFKLLPASPALGKGLAIVGASWQHEGEAANIGATIQELVSGR